MTVHHTLTVKAECTCGFVIFIQMNQWIEYASPFSTTHRCLPLEEKS